MGVADTVYTQKTLDLSDTYVIGLDTNIVGLSVKDPIGQTPGAAGDGVTNDYLAIYNAQQRAIALGVGLYFPPGRYNYGTGLTFTVPVTFAPGAVLAPTTAYQTTFNAPINALPVQIFSSTLASAQYVSINGLTPFVYAEWFGALGNGSTDDSTAINAALACISSGGIVQLLARPYKIASTLNFANHSTVLQGKAIGPSPYDGSGVKGTQIIGTNGVNGIAIASLQYCEIRELGLALATGATSACVGITFTGTLQTKIDKVRVTNYATGIQAVGQNTDSSIDRSYVASVGVTTAQVVGIEINGSAGQNQTIYVSRCISAHSSFTGTALSYWVHGTKINDTYFDDCEADFSTWGFYIDGSSATAGYAADIHLRGCVADTIGTGGFYIYLPLNQGGVEISNGWVAAGVYGIFADVASQNLRVTGMQCYGQTSTGIYTKGPGAIISNNQIYYAQSNGIVVNGANCTIQGNMFISNAASPSVDCINVLTGSDHTSIMGNCVNGNGVAGAFNIGIAIAGGADYCNVIGNCMNSTTVTTPYNLNLGSNTHTYQAGTTA
jgi:hypothetical protein